MANFAASFEETRLAALRSGYSPQSLGRSDLLRDEYMLAEHRSYRVYYVPIDTWPDPDSRVIFVGLTPGYAQLEAAARLFVSSPEALRSDKLAYSHLIRTNVAFAGTMRRILCRMLDDLGMPECFNAIKAEEFFGEECKFTAATSALVLPVFTGSTLANFSGTHDLSKVPLFQQMLTALLLPRLNRAPGAMIVPFGVSAGTGLTYLVRQGHINAERVLTGFPHPSGNNGHRKKQFEQNRDRLKETIFDWTRISKVAS